MSVLYLVSRRFWLVAPLSKLHQLPGDHLPVEPGCLLAAGGKMIVTVAAESIPKLRTPMLFHQEILAIKSHRIGCDKTITFI